MSGCKLLERIENSLHRSGGFRKTFVTTTLGYTHRIQSIRSVPFSPTIQYVLPCRSVGIVSGKDWLVYEFPISGKLPFPEGLRTFMLVLACKHTKNPPITLLRGWKAIGGVGLSFLEGTLYGFPSIVYTPRREVCTSILSIFSSVSNFL